MPLIIQFNYTDGSSEVQRIPAYIWRKNESEVTKVFPTKKEVESIVLDPYRETADIDEENNYFPRRDIPSRFELFKRENGPRGAASGTNPMKEAKKKK